MGHNHSKASKHVCNVPDMSGPAIQPIVGNFNFHTVAMIVSGATGLFAIIITLLLIFWHATHFSNPAEQKQIMRAIFIIPPFAVICFLCVWLDGSPQQYITPALDVAEAFPMAAFFLLISTYVVPDDGDREAFFSQLQLIDKKGNELGGGSLQWYRRLTFGVMQWVPTSIILWIAAVITEAANIYCSTSNSVHFAHIWITTLRMICVTWAILAILRFYGRSKPVLKPRGVLKKLICFKIIVFLNTIQTFIFNFLKSGGHLHANKYLTFNDLADGLPSLILSCEIALLAPFFWFAYPVRPYIIRSSSTPEAGQSTKYHGGFLGLGAIFSAMNILDIISELVKAVSARSKNEPTQGGYMATPAPPYEATHDGIHGPQEMYAPQEEMYMSDGGRRGGRRERRDRRRQRRDRY